MASRRSALIVASYEFKDPKLRQLRSPATDAEQLAKVLRDPSIGDFDVQMSPNRPEYQVRREVAAFFAKRSRDDLLLLHFACHGVKDDDGNLYFATADTEIDSLDATAVSAEGVNRQISRSRSRRVVLLLDCCYSGAFASGMVSRGDESIHIKERFVGDGRGRVVLTASNAMEYAWEGDSLSGTGQPSVFTSALVRALKSGEADANRDGWISVDELYDFVYEHVIEETPNQTPGKWSFDVEGDLFIAQSRVRRPTTALPAELLTAAESPLSGVREGAIQELGRLLRSNDPDVRAAARTALVSLVDDDSRRVSEAARETLGGIKTKDSPAENDRLTIVLPEAGSSAAEELPEHREQTSTGLGPIGRSGKSTKVEAVEVEVAPGDKDGAPPDGGVKVKQRPIAVEPKRAPWSSRPVVWIGAGVLVLVAVTAVVIFVLPDRPPVPDSPPGIAFARASEAEAAATLLLVEGDGSNARPLEGAPKGIEDPAWAPDGSRIAFIKEGDLYVMDIDDSEIYQFTSTPEDEDHPAWSPDGTEIAFGRGEPSDIWVMNADGTDYRPLTDTPVEDENGPTWSSDGSKIAFRWASALGASSDIYVMNSDGSDPQPLTSDPLREVAPAWSPDGSMIAFRRAERIYVMNEDGTGPHEITIAEADAAGLHFEAAPEWSPDSSVVIFEGASSRDAPTDIYRIDADGTNLRRLTSTPEWEFGPTW
jgi:hypothetical protein